MSRDDTEQDDEIGPPVPAALVVLGGFGILLIITTFLAISMAAMVMK